MDAMVYGALPGGGTSLLRAGKEVQFDFPDSATDSFVLGWNAVVESLPVIFDSLMVSVGAALGRVKELRDAILSHGGVVPVNSHTALILSHTPVDEALPLEDFIVSAEEAGVYDSTMGLCSAVSGAAGEAAQWVEMAAMVVETDKDRDTSPVIKMVQG